MAFATPALICVLFLATPNVVTSLLGDCVQGAIHLDIYQKRRTEVDGLVRVCNRGAWCTVCGSNFDESEASVACRQLGYSPDGSTAINLTRRGGPVYPMDFDCVGNESRLVNCTISDLYDDACEEHQKDVKILCKLIPETDCDIFAAVRLRDGGSDLTGRVEICFKETWGTVCDTGWNDIAARVVCQNLGFPGFGSVALTRDDVVDGTGLIWMDNISCDENDFRLYTCNSTDHEKHQSHCSHSEDAGVSCSNVVQFVRQKYKIAEGQNGRLKLYLKRPSLISVTVLVSTTNGSAYAPDDFKSIFTTVTFKPGVRLLTIPFSTKMNDKIEEKRIFTVSLSNSSAGLVINETAVVVVTIIDVIVNNNIYMDTETKIYVGLGITFAVLFVLIGVSAFILTLIYRQLNAIEEDACRKDDYLFRSVIPSMQSFKRNVSKHHIVNSTDLDLKECIGQGEYGIVYRALLNKTGGEFEEVAIKTVGGFYDVTLAGSLMEECSKMFKLDHPNVLRAIGICMDGGAVPYIVMPLMSNDNLKEYLDKERYYFYVTPEKITSGITVNVENKLLDFCLQMAKGMEYIASQKILHRDLAAKNCLVDSNNVIKVSDFGLSETLAPFTNYFKETKDDLKLPFKWMSPESLLGGIFSEKTDVWSYGITCWEIFSCGRIPHAGLNAAQLSDMLKQGFRMKKPLNLACTDEIFQDLIMVCWNEEPADRPCFSSIVHYILQFINVRSANLVSMATNAEDVAHLFAKDTTNAGSEKTTADAKDKITADVKVSSTTADADDIITEDMTTADFNEATTADVKDMTN